MPSLFSDIQAMPDHWPVLDAAHLPTPRRLLEDHWREPQRIERPRHPEGRRSGQPMPPAPLSPLAMDWYGRLPDVVRPRRLAERHPHVINQLTLVWDLPEQRRAALRNLLLADRHDRQGFSFEVLEELARLQEYAMR